MAESESSSNEREDIGTFAMNQQVFSDVCQAQEHIYCALLSSSTVSESATEMIPADAKVRLRTSGLQLPKLSGTR